MQLLFLFLIELHIRACSLQKPQLRIHEVFFMLPETSGINNSEKPAVILVITSAPFSTKYDIMRDLNLPYAASSGLWFCLSAHLWFNVDALFLNAPQKLVLIIAPNRRKKVGSRVVNVRRHHVYDSGSV